MIESIILGMIGPWQIALLVFFFIIPLFALVDILRNEFTGNNKIIWVLVILFIPLFGTLLYLVIGRKQRIP